MSHFGFLQFTICLRVFPAKYSLLSPDAGLKVEKPHHARFFTDFLRLGRSRLSAAPGRYDVCRLGGYKGNGQVLGAEAAKTLAGNRLRHQSRAPLLF